jgi:hypothetical protein
MGLWEYFFFLAMSVVTGGGYIWPQAVLSASGTESLWAVAGSMLLALTMSSLALLWMRISSPGILVDRLRQSWGALRWPIMLTDVALCLLLDTAMLTLFVQMLAAVFYPATPLWIMKALIAAFAAWFASRSLSALSRNIQFWFPLLALTFFLLMGMSFAQVRQGWAVGFGPWTAWTPIARGIVCTWFLWKQNEVILSISYFVRPGNPVLIRRVTWLAILFQCVVILGIYAVTVGSMGPQATQLLRWPLVYALSNLSTHSFYLSRPGLLILLIWTAAMVFYLASHLFCMGINLSRLFTGSYAATGLAAAVLAAGIGAGSLMIGSPTAATHLVLDDFNPLDLTYSFAVIVISILVLILTRFLAWRRSQRRPLS